MLNPAINCLDRNIRRVLLVRLRSIGDTVLMTPCLTALKTWQPDLEIDVLVESLSAPVLRSHPLVSQLFVLPTVSGQLRKLRTRLKIIQDLRARHYDVAFNLHGGSTAMFLTRLSAATTTVGYASGRYAKLLSIQAPEPQIIWQKPKIHCVEQQLALLKWVGIPITEPPASNLSVDPQSKEFIEEKLKQAKVKQEFIVIHPSAAFASKQWETKRFIEVIEYLYNRYKLISVIAVAPNEKAIAEAIKKDVKVPIVSFTDLNLAQLMALIAQAKLFLGNDSGPAHIAAALKKAIVVIFGSSNSDVWHPWSTKYRLLRADLKCIPCPGYTCSEFPEPECIKKISVTEVIKALDEILIAIN